MSSEGAKMTHLARKGRAVEQEAAQAYVESGRRQTVHQLVADFCVMTQGRWFNNADLNDIPGVGLAAQRRRRELATEYGWVFDERRVDKNTWQFRLISIPRDYDFDNPKRMDS